MMRLPIFICFVGLLLILSACGASLPRSDTALPTVSIEGVGAITAGGYIEISSIRHDTRQVHFNPWPAYFDLFPFAMLEGVSIPVFGLTNDADEIFALLEIDPVDVPHDQFGRQIIENVTAVFGNFEQVRFLLSGGATPQYRFGSVSAEMISAATPSEDVWSLEDVQFLLVADGENPPLIWHEGEDFMDLHLASVGWAQAFMLNGKPYRMHMWDAVVTGQVVLHGDLMVGMHFDSEWRVQATFVISDESLIYLPHVTDFMDGASSLWVNNLYALMDVLGIDEDELPQGAWLTVGGITARFDITWMTPRSYSAYFVEIVG